jgi:hypothetical protein
MENNTNNKANIRFSDYVFTKMDPEHEATSAKNCNETNITARKFEHIRKWMIANLLLIITVSGVLFGLFLGEFAPVFSHKVCQLTLFTEPNRTNESISRLPDSGSVVCIRSCTNETEDESLVIYRITTLIVRDNHMCLLAVHSIQTLLVLHFLCSTSYFVMRGYNSLGCEIC